MAYPKSEAELHAAIEALDALIGDEKFSAAVEYIDQYDLMNRADNFQVLSRDYAMLHLVAAEAYLQLSKQTKNQVQQNIAEDQFKTALFIDKNNKWAQLGYADVQLEKGRKRDAMVTYRMLIHQINHPQNESERNDNDHIIRKLLSNNKFVKSATKSEVFDLMKLLPIAEQKEMLENVINKQGLLGARIWEKEGLSQCKLGHGMLKNVQEQLDRIAKHQGLDDAGLEMQTTRKLQ